MRDQIHNTLFVITRTIVNAIIINEKSSLTLSPKYRFLCIYVSVCVCVRFADDEKCEKADISRRRIRMDYFCLIGLDNPFLTPTLGCVGARLLLCSQLLIRNSTRTSLAEQELQFEKITQGKIHGNICVRL